MGLLDKGFKWVVSSSFLSLIPAIWYGLTAYLFAVTGLSRPVTLYNILWIFLRTFTLSYMILSYASMFSPSKTYNLLLKLGLGKYSVVPLAVWRLVPYGLTNMVESLAIGELKKESVRKRLAPALASIIEAGDLVKISSYYKLYVEPRYSLPIGIDNKYNLVLVTFIVLTITITVLNIIYGETILV